jgi:hypothetical protein
MKTKRSILAFLFVLVLLEVLLVLGIPDALHSDNRGQPYTHEDYCYELKGNLAEGDYNFDSILKVLQAEGCK